MPPFHCTMVSWHGIMAWMKGRIPDFSKTQGQKIRFALKPIWVRALSQIFSQVYITRPWLQFCRPPKISKKFSFFNFAFQIFGFQVLPAKYWPEPKKSEIRNFQKEKNPRILGGLQNCRQGLVILIWLNI